MQRLSILIVGVLVGVLGVGIGAHWLFAPDSAAAAMGITLTSPLAYSTARGDMGGAFVALGLVTALGLMRRESRYLEAVAIAVGAIAIGRLVALAADGFDSLAVVAIVSEVIFVAALVVTARRMDEIPGL